MLGRHLLDTGNDIPQRPVIDQHDVTPSEPGQEQDPQSIGGVEYYKSPIDFESLWDRNTDIYAWLDIPGSEISQPVLRKEGDSDYYIKRDLDKKYSEAGSLFTQSTWNGSDFTDIVTIIYGHKMKSGAMFGTLQLFYSDEENFKEHNELVIYLPDREIKYKVFAAVPFDNRHLWMTYNFYLEDNYKRFISDIYSQKALGANLDESVEFNYQDRMLILSTCLRGNLNKRYLVCALEVTE